MQNLSNPAEIPASNASQRQVVLFVGLGTMGLPMASNVVRAGFDVRGFDTHAPAVAALVQAGGRAADDPSGVAAVADVIITMLPDDKAVLNVLKTGASLLAAARPGTLVIEMSTTSPTTKIELGAIARARGVDFIECPVGKTMEHAIAGTLTLMAGGDAALIDRARPVLAAMGNELHVCGALGAGSTIKLINNALVACINAASLEALVAGSKANIDIATMMGVFKTTMAWNNALAMGLPKKALRRDFKPGFMTRLAHKDVGLALSMAKALAVPMTQGEAAYAILDEALRDGFADDDNSGSMMRVCESRGGVQLSH